MVDNQKSAFVFPGAAVEPCGAEAGFYAKHREVMWPFVVKASEAAGLDLEETLDKGLLSGLDERNSQLFTFAYSHAVAQAHRHAGVSPAVVAGYSLGIYAAITVSGALAFDQGLSVVGAVFDIMKEQCTGGAYAMGAVVGLLQSDTDRIVASGKFPSICRTNTNNETCGVFSGTAQDIETFFAEARTQGALSTVTFRVSIPYHHPKFIGGASARFARVLKDFSFCDAAVPVISSIDQRPLVKPGDLVEFVVKNFSSPVHWQKVTETIAAMGVATVYECGPGISLCQNGRFIPNRLRYITVRRATRRDAV
ncbi:MAG TPA: ACP S-malonyltransferase [Chitinivibrionales bacterium]|jgi:[acyl-carrier-protein] S-malonyltransferase|nr:ACP S-malonyltransferase [Chitinivibrionales bacterium]